MSDTGSEVVPFAGDADGGGRLAEIRQIARTDPDRYDSDKALQAEQIALLESGLTRAGRQLAGNRNCGR